MGPRSDVDGQIVALAQQNGMVITAEQMAAAGVAWHLIRAREGGLLTRLARGVYAVGEITPEVRLRAALASVVGCAGSHCTAGRRHRLPVEALGVVEVLAERRTRLRMPGVRVRSTTWLPAEDVAVVDGARVTTVARTICDLAAVVPRRRLGHVVESAITGGRVTAGEVQACAAAWCRRGRAGSGALRALDHELLDAEPLAASELERRAVRLLRQRGIAGWTAQYRPPWYDGMRGVVDLAWPAERVVVELDGRRWHATTQAQAEDRRRDRLATAHGWVTLRFGWQEVVHRPAAVTDECRAVLTARRP